MSQHATRETCPKCTGPAVVTWLGIAAYGHTRPVREEAISLDCRSGCSLADWELAAHFPAKVRVPS